MKTMVYVCIVPGCTHRRKKQDKRSFHSFPLSDVKRREKWIKNLSRENEDGSKWMPTKFSRICSDHFLPTDYVQGTLRQILKDAAVPTQFPSYPGHKRPCRTPSPPPPTLSPLLPQMPSCRKTKSKTSEPTSKEVTIAVNHSYSGLQMEEALQNVSKALAEANKKLEEKRNEVKLLKRKIHRRDVMLAAIIGQLKSKQSL